MLTALFLFGIPAAWADGSYASPLAADSFDPSHNGKKSDEDYNDYMFLIDGAKPGKAGSAVAPVPEPVTISLFGIGLLGMGVLTLRRKLCLN